MASTKTISGKFVEALFESDNDNDNVGRNDDDGDGGDGDDNEDNGPPGEPTESDISNRIGVVIKELGLSNVNVKYVLGDLKKTFGMDFSKRKDISALIKEMSKKTVTFNDAASSSSSTASASAPVSAASPKHSILKPEIVPSSVAPTLTDDTHAGIVESVVPRPPPPPPPPSSPEIVSPIEPSPFNVQQIAEIIEFIQTSADINKKLAEILNIKKRAGPSSSSKSTTAQKKAKTGHGRGKKSTRDRLIPRADVRCTFINEPVERYCSKQRNRGDTDIYCATHKYRVSKDAVLAEKQEKLYNQHHVALDANARKEAGWVIPAGESKPVTGKEFGKLRQYDDDDDNSNNEDNNELEAGM